METTFSKQETIKLLEEYYKRLEGKQVKVDISAKAGCIGLYETPGCITTIAISETMDIAGIKKDVKITLSEEEVTKQLRALFALYELDLKSLSYEDGISSSCEGYGMMEHTVRKAYFNGVRVNIEKMKSHNLSYTY